MTLSKNSIKLNKKSKRIHNYLLNLDIFNLFYIKKQMSIYKNITNKNCFYS